ncbi:hypothetical protein D3C81_1544500 [compost metagenome]
MLSERIGIVPRMKECLQFIEQITDATPVMQQLPAGTIPFRVAVAALVVTGFSDVPVDNQFGDLRTHSPLFTSEIHHYSAPSERGLGVEMSDVAKSEPDLDALVAHRHMNRAEIALN